MPHMPAWLRCSAEKTSNRKSRRRGNSHHFVLARWKQTLLSSSLRERQSALTGNEGRGDCLTPLSDIRTKRQPCEESKLGWRESAKRLGLRDAARL
jgi:hypothetical protein